MEHLRESAEVSRGVSIDPTPTLVQLLFVELCNVYSSFFSTRV